MESKTFNFFFSDAHVKFVCTHIHLGARIGPHGVEHNLPAHEALDGEGEEDGEGEKEPGKVHQVI